MTQPWHEPGFLEIAEKENSLEIARLNIDMAKRFGEISELIKPYMNINCRGWSCCAYCSTLESVATQIDEIIKRER
jgi:hypothetical protein